MWCYYSKHDGVTFCTVARSNEWRYNFGEKKFTGHDRSATSHFISFTAFLYNIFWCSFPKRLSLSIFKICFLQPGMPATEARETHGRWCFLSSIPWNQRLWWATFSSITQARIITVQLLVCVAATARIGIGPLVGRVNQPSAVALRRLFSVRCKTLKVRLHNVILPFYSNFCAVLPTIPSTFVYVYFFISLIFFPLDSRELFLIGYVKWCETLAVI